MHSSDNGREHPIYVDVVFAVLKSFGLGAIHRVAKSKQETEEER